ncbi:MAG TPA: hypothetical protein VFD49_21915 [Candidatus Dormibacteraeota bacterium]|nr:hypothetical protein [Candidatus Dormibacteraeota bacterium]
MRGATLVAQTVVRLAGLVLIVLGILIWTGTGDALVPAHVLVGLLLVLALWTLAILAALAQTRTGMAALAAAWGLVVVLLGSAQQRLMPGSTHWVIQALHLLVGLTAIALAELLAAGIRRGRPQPAGG